MYACAVSIPVHSQTFRRTLVERRMLNKLLSILDNPDQPLHPLHTPTAELLLKQTDSTRLPQRQMQEIFLPSATTLFNKQSNKFPCLG